MNRFDADHVRDSLRAAPIFDRYGVGYRHAGAELRTSVCPRCGAHKRECLSVGVRGPYWCMLGGHGGDLLELVALFEGVDCRRDFPRVLATAADIAGVAPNSRHTSNADRQERRRRAVITREGAHARKLASATRIAEREWARLRPGHPDGEHYLAERALSALCGRDDVVRFDARGSVRVPLYGWDGRRCDVPMRYLPERHRGVNTTQSIRGCTTEGAFGGLHQLADATGDVMLTEGVFDYLSGRVLWPSRAVLGAHGASRLACIAHEVASRIVNTGRTLFLVPHHDPAGLTGARKAMRAALSAGMPRERVRALDVSSAGDLNDWLRRKQQP